MDLNTAVHQTALSSKKGLEAMLTIVANPDMRKGLTPEQQEAWKNFQQEMELSEQQERKEDALLNEGGELDLTQIKEALQHTRSEEDVMLLVNKLLKAESSGHLNEAQRREVNKLLIEFTDTIMAWDHQATLEGLRTPKGSIDTQRIRREIQTADEAKADRLFFLLCSAKRAPQITPEEQQHIEDLVEEAGKKMMEAIGRRELKTFRDLDGVIDETSIRKEIRTSNKDTTLHLSLALGAASKIPGITEEERILLKTLSNEALTRFLRKTKKDL